MTGTDAWLWPTMAAPIMAAPFIGSFLGVLIVRLPVGAPVVFGRSACSECGTSLRGWEMVPLVGYAVLRGRCRHCGRPIGLFHPAVELAAIAVVAWAVLADPDPGMLWPDPARLWVDCGLGWVLLTLAWIDIDSFLLPDVLTLPLLLAGLALTAAVEPDALADHCLAAIFGYASFEIVAVAYRRLRGREGLGGGDAKLIAAAGAWCGLGPLPFIVLASAAAGLIAALGLALAGQAVTSRTRIAFGPCIAAAFWLAWLYGGRLDLLFGRPG